MRQDMGTWLRVVVGVVLGFSLGVSGADLAQSLSLPAGWTSVWLEVTPGEASPQTVFGGTSVDVVAGYYPVGTTVQFISDPSETDWKQPGWGVWYAPSRAESVLNTLTRVDGGRAYLIHALAPATVTVRGTPVSRPLRWLPNSLNFVGLPVDPESAPTFGEFFAGSAAHASGRVYRLTEGCWRPLASASTTPIVRGVAYWVYCTGRSEWQGPLELQVGGLSGVSFGAVSSAVQWRVVNRGETAIAAALARESGDLPLCTEQVEAQTQTLSYPPLSTGQSLGSIGASRAVEVWLQVRREQMTRAQQDAVLSVRGGGCLSYVAVSATRGTP